MASLKCVVILSLLMMMLAHCNAHHENGNPEMSPLPDNIFEPTSSPSDDEIVNSKTDKPEIKPRMLYASVNAP